MEKETVKVKAWGEGQGDFVLVDKDEFDNAPAGTYELYHENQPEVKKGKK